MNWNFAHTSFMILLVYVNLFGQFPLKLQSYNFLYQSSWKKIHECHFLSFESSTRRASTPEKFQKSKNAYSLNGGNIR